MKRWWLAIALLLSLGVNAGILATFAVSRLTAAKEPPVAEESRSDRGSRGAGKGSETG